MYHRGQRCIVYRVLVSLCVVSVLLGAAAADAEIFKCMAKSGLPLYQNFPCNLESLGSLPSTAAATNTASAIDHARKPSSAQAPNQTPTRAGELRIGMRTDEVRTLWGEPMEMVADEPAEGGPVSVWRYADGRSVQFDHQHHVMEVQQ